MSTIRMSYDKTSGQYIAYEDQKEIARSENLSDMVSKLRAYFEKDKDRQSDSA